MPQTERTPLQAVEEMEELLRLNPSPGVTWHKDRKKWCAQIKIAGKNTHLGIFSDEADAATAYNLAAYLAWGEFAKMNSPLMHDGLVEQGPMRACGVTGRKAVTWKAN